MVFIRVSPFVSLVIGADGAYANLMIDHHWPIAALCSLILLLGWRASSSA